jgi:arylesterase/paraoxonase
VLPQGTFRNSTGDGGKIWVYNYSGAGSIKPLKLVNFDLKEATFHPLGIEYWAPSNTLYVINHGTLISTIEIFSVDFSKSTATHVRSFSHALIPYPNSLALVGKDEFYVTNDHLIGARTSQLFAKIETYLSIPLASVVYVDLNAEKVAVSARVAWANGITLLNPTTIAVASTSTPGVYLYSYDPETKILVNLSLQRLPFFPDNISTDSRGRLLITGHPHPPSLEIVSKTNYQFDLDGKKDDSARPRSPSWVVEWDGEMVRDIYVDDGTEFGCSSTAVWDNSRGVGIITGLYEKGILVWTNK